MSVNVSEWQGKLVIYNVICDVNLRPHKPCAFVPLSTSKISRSMKTSFGRELGRGDRNSARSVSDDSVCRVAEVTQRVATKERTIFFVGTDLCVRPRITRRFSGRRGGRPLQ